MVASIVGFHSRAELRMRRPKSVSHNIKPDEGGSTKHYGGSGGPPSNHVGCIRTWLDWQAFHMNPVSQGGRNWVDIAYTGGYCNHGYAFAGRGFGVRTAANGTNDGNDRSYAFVWIGGGNSQPTQLALNALDWWFAEARRAGNAGPGEYNHRDWKSTTCPGDYLAGYHIGHSTLAPEPEDDMEQHEKDLLEAIHTQVTKGYSTDLIADAKGEPLNPWAAIGYSASWSKQALSQIAGLSAAVNKLADLVGKQEGADATEIKAAVFEAIQEAVVSVDVNVNSREETG